MTCTPHNPPTARVLFVGASASAAEEARGEAGVGPVGAVLKACYLPAAGLDHGDVAIAHIVPMHLTDRDGRGREPTPREIAQHRAHVDEIAKGRIVVALGQTAAKAMGCARWLPHPQLVVTGQVAKAEIARRCASLQKYLTRTLWCGNTVSDRTASQPPLGVKKARVIKAVAKKQIIYCVVTEPDEPDLEGDVTDAEDSEDTAHRYLGETAHVVGLEHKQVAKGCTVVESWVAQDGLSATPDYKQGTWLVGIKIPDPTLWSKYESGELTGLSLGGFGIRTPL